MLRKYDDVAKFDFVADFGFHRCFRDKDSGTLILHCRTKSNGNTIGINRRARDAFLAYESETEHAFHLETPIRSELFASFELPDAFHPMRDYEVFNIDQLVQARGQPANPPETAYAN